MAQVQQIRREVLPKELYELIERFMLGDISSLQITVMTNKKDIEHFSFGRTPRPLANVSSNDPCQVYEIGGWQK